MSTSQLFLMLCGPIVKVSQGMFPFHAEWTFCQNVPATMAPAACKVEGHMSLQQLQRKIEQTLESHQVRISHFLNVPGSHSPLSLNLLKMNRSATF